MNKDTENLIQSLTELALRLASLEELLITKGLITKEDFEKVINSNVKKVIDKINEAKNNLVP